MTILALLALLLAAIIAAEEATVDQINLDFLLQEFCFIPCSQEPQYSGQEWIPATGCEKYHNCNLGQVTSWAQCGNGLRFDPFNNHCAVASKVPCPAPIPRRCPPTFKPSPQPTFKPTLAPTPPPTPRPSAQPTKYPTQSPTPPPQSVARDYIRSKRDAIQRNVLVSYTNTGVSFPSSRYTFDGLMNGLDVIAVTGFGADFKFKLYEGDPDKWKKGLISVAAFLANAMVESIQYDSCDENNWQDLDGRFAISNACGQEGYSYEDEECSLEFESSCPVVSSMEITAVNGPIGYRVPPPLQCKPGKDNAGYWDSSVGQVVQLVYSNVAGREDIEGCCWWGRGALQSRGPCSIGKINYYLGKKGADLGRDTIYPNIDFCQFPEALCASADDKNLRWNAGLFEYAERVQTYNVDGWNYDNELNKFIQQGMTTDDFITTVSRIVSRKCHRQGCSQLEVRMLDQRIRHFFMIINDIFEVPMLFATPYPTPNPTRHPTPKPTMTPTAEIQKTNPSQSSAMPSRDQSIISTDETNNDLLIPTTSNPPNYSDGLIKLEDNAASRKAYRLSPFLAASTLFLLTFLL